MQCTAPKPDHTRTQRKARRSFPGTPTNIGEARTWTETTLTKWDIRIPETLTLVVSELATNAIDHTHSGRENGQFTLRLAVHEDRIRITVRDAGPKLGRTPTRRTPSLSSKHGRGLALVEALSLSWGALTIGTGVYAEVAR